MSDSSEDTLEIVPENEIPQLFDVVARELPVSYYVYGFLTTCYKRRKANPAYDVTFYRHRDYAQNGILATVLRTGNHTFGLLLYACEGYEDLLEYTLIKTSKINWHERPLFQGILPRHYSVVHNVLKSKHFEAKLYAHSTVVLLPIEKALNFNANIPDNVYVRQLTIEDVDSIYNSWPHKDVWTDDEIIHAIRCDISFGVFSKDTNKIQSWVMFPHYGSIGMLYTAEYSRRLGYAKLLVVLISKELARMGITPTAAIMKINTKSLSLFYSLGFREVTDIKFFTVGM